MRRSCSMSVDPPPIFTPLHWAHKFLRLAPLSCCPPPPHSPLCPHPLCPHRCRCRRCRCRRCRRWRRCFRRQALLACAAGASLLAPDGTPTPARDSSRIPGTQAASTARRAHDTLRPITGGGGAARMQCAGPPAVAPCPRAGRQRISCTAWGSPLRCSGRWTADVRARSASAVAMRAAAGGRGPDLHEGQQPDDVRLHLVADEAGVADQRALCLHPPAQTVSRAGAAAVTGARRSMARARTASAQRVPSGQPPSEVHDRSQISGICAEQSDQGQPAPPRQMRREWGHANLQLLQDELCAGRSS